LNLFKNIYLGFPLLALLLFSPYFGEAQPDYEPEGRVFTSLKQALEYPDPSDVTRLKLKRQKYSSIPKEIYQFKNLVELDLTGNRLVIISDSIALLENLVYLNLERNKLKTLPKGIDQLKKLKYLNIGKNSIRELDKSLSKLSELEFIQAWGNEITEIPDEFYKLKNLKYLDLRAIIITDDQREDMVKILPNTQIYFSPSCNCKN
jgi:Leucine-rich repeat (LRR) protein